MPVNRIPSKNVDVVIKFGGGLHTRAPETEVADNEATDGHNFDLDVENSDLKNRKPFDLLGTAPNAGSIKGGGSFRKRSGTVHQFFQAGDTVYEWNGSAFPTAQTFTVTIASPGVFTCNAHGYANGNTVVLSTTGALPTGLATSTLYYIVSATTNTFELSATSGGTAINTSGTQSGTHKVTAALAVVSSTAQLRAHWASHVSELDDLVLISDLNLQEVIKSWDGATWQNVTFTSNGSTALGSALYCKYIGIHDERAWYSNIKEASTTFPHLIVGSKQSDYTQVSVSNKPSSSLGASDPFFMTAPDLRAINGFVEAFGATIISTKYGKIFNLTGTNSTDFAWADFYPGSGAAGDESVAYIGNDVIYGRQGRIESLSDTNRFGNTAADDITKPIADITKDYTGWTTVFNSRLNRVYLFPSGVGEVWVLDTAMRGEANSLTGQRGNVSPWTRWTTTHGLAFQPTFVMSMLDASSGLEYVFMGDSAGSIYRLEGTGASGDGGTKTIQTQWVSKMISLPLDAIGSNIQGYVKYRKGDALDINVDLLFAGQAVYDDGITVSIPTPSTVGYYSGGVYYSDGTGYAQAFVGRLTRQRMELPGGDTNDFQVRVTVTSNNSVAINEIGLRFCAES